MAGKGRATVNGKNFEALQTFAAALRAEPFTLEPVNHGGKSLLYAVLKGSEVVGYYGAQGAVYVALKMALASEARFTNEYIKHVLSRKIVPDEFLIVLQPRRRLVIVEKKVQSVSGSTDEKLQTAPFKVSMFQKLVASFDVQVEYVYVLSAWFQQRVYRNIAEYYEAFTNVKLFVEGLNLDRFSLAEYFR